MPVPGPEAGARLRASAPVPRRRSSSSGRDRLRSGRDRWGVGEGERGGLRARCCGDGDAGEGLGFHAGGMANERWRGREAAR